MKSKKQEKRRKTGEKRRKGKKRGPKRGPRWAQKLIFHIRTELFTPSLRLSGSTSHRLQLFLSGSTSRRLQLFLSWSTSRWLQMFRLWNTLRRHQQFTLPLHLSWKTLRQHLSPLQLQSWSTSRQFRLQRQLCHRHLQHVFNLVKVRIEFPRKFPP